MPGASAPPGPPLGAAEAPRPGSPLAYGELEKGGKAPRRPLSSPVVAGAAYCAVSAAMVLLNKFALRGLSCPNALVLAQCLASVLFVKGGQMLGVWRVEPLRWDILRIWLPVNVIFALMIASSAWALQLVGVGMITITKNLTNIFTICGDYFLYGRVYNGYVWAALVLITGSAVVGASTDLDFTAAGYAAQLANCLFTAAYSLVLRGVMDRVTAILGRKMETQSEVFYNNALSLPFVAALAVLNGEPAAARGDAGLRSPAFLAAAGLSCVIGFSISYAALWFLSTTTPTTYSLVGSLNKIPVAAVGMLLFDAAATPANVASIAVGLLAGIMFVRAKQL